MINFSWINWTWTCFYLFFSGWEFLLSKRKRGKGLRETFQRQLFQTGQPASQPASQSVREVNVRLGVASAVPTFLISLLQTVAADSVSGPSDADSPHAGSLSWWTTTPQLYGIGIQNSVTTSKFFQLIGRKYLEKFVISFLCWCHVSVHQTGPYNYQAGEKKGRPPIFFEFFFLNVIL